MKVCLFGVGRSGTTALYGALQEILLDFCGNNVHFVYEPFLWDEATFAGRYQEVSDRFGSLESISSEGIYHHLQCPLFVTEYRAAPYGEWLRAKFERSEHVLLKEIRATGRFRLLRHVGQGAKFLFVIRNPLDVVNSVLPRFSFFGHPYHRDDFPRFSAQVATLYGVELRNEQVTSRVAREALYWYFMNRFALESFRESDTRPLVLCYERLHASPRETIECICDFLGIVPRSTYMELLGNDIGPTTSSIHLTRREVSALEPLMHNYARLLAEHGVNGSFDIDQVLERYRTGALAARAEDEMFGKPPMVVLNGYRAARKELAQLRREHARLQDQFEQWRGQAREENHVRQPLPREDPPPPWCSALGLTALAPALSRFGGSGGESGRSAP
ncbi:MAG: sulfotransferase [Planctomycetota bacterium]